MYSIIPTPQVAWTDKALKNCFYFYPLIGLLIGAIWYAMYYLLSGFNANFTAIVLLLIPIIISGGIHFDGLIDTCDATFSYGDPAKKLTILKDPHVGAFGIISAATYLLMLFGVYSQIISNNQLIGVVPFIFALSRSLGALPLLYLKRAKPDGLGATFANAADTFVVLALLLWTAILFAIICVLNLYVGLLLILVCTIFLAIFIPYATKQFGGMTGDLAGFITSSLELLLPLSIAIGGTFL